MVDLGLTYLTFLAGAAFEFGRDLVPGSAGALNLGTDFERVYSLSFFLVSGFKS